MMSKRSAKGDSSRGLAVSGPAIINNERRMYSTLEISQNRVDEYKWWYHLVREPKVKWRVAVKVAAFVTGRVGAVRSGQATSVTGSKPRGCAR